MQTADLPPPRTISLGTQLACGFGFLAYGIKDGFSTLLLFYNQVVHLQAGLVGAAILVALVLDAAMDRLIGYLSDHTRSFGSLQHCLVPVGRGGPPPASGCAGRRGVTCGPLPGSEAALPGAAWRVA